MSEQGKRLRPGVPRRPLLRAANPEPMIPAPQRDSTALRISYGGCEWCGKPTISERATSCVQCASREQSHHRRMNDLAEHEAELRNQLLEQQLEHGKPTDENGTDE